MAKKISFNNHNWFTLRSICPIIIHQACDVCEGYTEKAVHIGVKKMLKLAKKSKNTLIKELLVKDKVFDLLMKKTSNASDKKNAKKLDKAIALVSSIGNKKELKELAIILISIAEEIVKQEGISKTEQILLDEFKTIMANKFGIPVSAPKQVVKVAQLATEPDKDGYLETYTISDELSVKLVGSPSDDDEEAKTLYIVKVRVNEENLNPDIDYRANAHIYEIRNANNEPCELLDESFSVEGSIFVEKLDENNRKLHVDIIDNEGIRQKQEFIFTGIHKGDFVYKIPELIRMLDDLSNFESWKEFDAYTTNVE